MSQFGATLKGVAGKVLLYFYYLQRTDPAYLFDSILSYQMRHFGDETTKSPKLEHETEISRELHKISNSDADLYNAILYLSDLSLIVAGISSTNVGDSFHNIRVSAAGVQLIEDIERGESERQEFNVIFNINVENNLTVESLLKANLGSILSGVNFSS